MNNYPFKNFNDKKHVGQIIDDYLLMAACQIALNDAKDDKEDSIEIIDRIREQVRKEYKI